MKTRYIVLAAFTFFTTLWIFSSVGEPRCTQSGVYNVGDMAGIALVLFAIVFSSIAVGYTLGKDDGKEEGFRAR